MKKNLIPVLLMLPIILSSCGLLPVEETLPAVPVIREYEKQEYKQTTVMRGDLVSSVSVSCTYNILKQENLSFSIGGVLIDEVYVTKGQSVNEGDLLYSLDMENVQEMIDVQKNTIGRLALQLDQLYEMRAVYLKKHDYVLDNLAQQLQEVEQLIAQAQRPAPAAEENTESASDTESSDDIQRPNDDQDKPDMTELLLRQQALLAEQSREQSARNATVSEYASKIRNIEDSLYVQNVRLSEMEQSMQERQILSPMNGTVTFVREVKEGDRSVKGTVMITVCDWNYAYFQVKSKKHVGYFPAGMEVDIQVGDTTHKATVLDPQTLGDLVDPESETVYLQLVQADPTISSGTYGTIVIVLDQRTDVLYVDKDAIHTSAGASFVYMLDENGLRISRQVKTGMETNDYVQITDGLQEGDHVILD